ncbi:MAG: HAD hydrolase-like protein [Rhodoferax sp.]
MVERPDFLLFDLDGTLSDPLVGIGRSINYALSHFGFEPLALTELAAYVGPPLDQTFRTLTGATTEGDIHAMVAKYRERYADVGYSENVLYPEIPEALNALAIAGIPMGVCTSKRVDFAEKILTMFGLRAHFGFVSGAEIGTHKWQQIADLLAIGMVSTSSIMVGDRDVDMIAPHRNGLQAAGVLWGYGSRAELEKEKPRFLLEHPTALASLYGAATPAAAP